MKIFLFKVICFEREGEREGGGQRDRGERIPNRLHSIMQGPMEDWDLMNCEIIT